MNIAEEVAALIVANIDSVTVNFFVELDNALQAKGYRIKAEQLGITGTYLTLEPVE